MTTDTQRKRRLLLLTLLGGGAVSYGQQIRNVETSSIIESYPLSETSGTAAIGAKNGFNGTYSANVALNVITFPDGTPAPLFDANSEHIQLPAASLDTLWADGIEGTLFAWLKVSAVGVWTDGVSRAPGGIGFDLSNRVVFNKPSSANRLNMEHIAGGTTKQIAVTSFSPTAWFSAAITWNKALDRVRGYINGVQQGADATALGVMSTSALTNSFSQISSSSTTFYWPGYIKYWTIWSKELTAAQLLALSPVVYQV